MNTNIHKLLTELREEVQIINSKIDALEAELRCSEPDETEEIPFDVPHIEDEELTPRRRGGNRGAHRRICRNLRDEADQPSGRYRVADNDKYRQLIDGESAH